MRAFKITHLAIVCLHRSWRFHSFRITQNWASYIQGVSRLVDITAGGDFLSLCDQKS